MKTTKRKSPKSCRPFTICWVLLERQLKKRSDEPIERKPSRLILIEIRTIQPQRRVSRKSAKPMGYSLILVKELSTTVSLTEASIFLSHQRGTLTAPPILRPRGLSKVETSASN
jgi:hypothetical protein